MAARTKAPTMIKGARVSMSLTLILFWLQHLEALAVEIGFDPRMVGTKQIVHWTNGDDSALAERGDAVANNIQAGEIVRDHERRQTKRLVQRLDKGIEVARGDRVQTGRRLVEKHDRGVECQRARQRNPLRHPAGKLGWKLVAVLRRQTNHLELSGRNFIHQRVGKHEILAQRKLNVLANGQRRKQRSLLEQNAPPAGCGSSLVTIADAVGHELDTTASLRNKPDDRAHQHRLTTPGGSDQAEDFTLANVQRQMFDHGLPAEPNDDVADADRKLGRGFFHCYIPIHAKNTANTPSSTITKKIDLTTDVVVCRPRDSALPLTLRPSVLATMPMTSAIKR